MFAEQQLAACIQLLQGMVAAGLETIIISPGARNTPMILAADLHPQIKTEVILDERGAAFFALGLAKVKQRPVALLATSGSAPAHWLPAVIEAYQSQVPLILISADRPWELHHCGANQTIVQNNLFKDFVTAVYEIDLAQSADRRLLQLGKQLMQTTRPVQLNLALREPLVPDVLPQIEPVQRRWIQPARLAPSPEQIQWISQLRGCGLFIAGRDCGQRLLELSEKTGIPIWADILSDLRYRPEKKTYLISDYEYRLEQAPAPDWILRWGKMPISKKLQHWLQKQSCPQILIHADTDWQNEDQQADWAIIADPDAVADALIPLLPVQQSEADFFSQKGIKTACWVQKIIQALPEDSLLFIGNSSPIRAFDAHSGQGQKRIRILGNRGVSGIDGLVSTALACSLGDHQGWTVAVLGDLSLQHDLNALANQGHRRLLLIVINNGGGGIFRQLPQAKLPQFESYWLCPQNIDFAHLAGLYGIQYQRQSLDDFSLAAYQPEQGLLLLELLAAAQPLL